MAAPPKGRMDLRERLIEEVATLEDEHGRVSPDICLAFAIANPESAIHAWLGSAWDDERAAHEYRLDKLRELITSVRYEVTVRRRTITTTRYVHDIALPPREQGYRAIDHVDEAGLADATVEAEVNRVAALIERGRNIAAALDLESEFIAGVRAALR